jgi:flavin-dependent dehydrogenase
VRYDVVIIGAGAAGTVATYAAAQAGLSVLCLEKRDLSTVGAHWINAIPIWCFEQAGIPLPSGDELKNVATHSTLVAGHSHTAIRFSAAGVVDVDMALLIQRLRRAAVDAGAELRGHVSVRSLSEAPEDNVVHTSQGDFRARTVVDATGIRGLNLVGAPGRTTHICVAAQQQRVITDPQAAKAFFDAYGVQEGEKLIFTGVEGGYSVVNLCMDGDEVGILTGSIPADGFLPGPALIQQLAREQPWIGEALRSGAGPIPLQAPIRPARGDVAAMGDQGAQVFAAHGSSLGATMVAASMLVKDAVRRRARRELGAALDAGARRAACVRVSVQSVLDGDEHGGSGRADEEWDALAGGNVRRAAAEDAAGFSS